MGGSGRGSGLGRGRRGGGLGRRRGRGSRSGAAVRFADVLVGGASNEAVAVVVVASAGRAGTEEALVALTDAVFGHTADVSALAAVNTGVPGSGWAFPTFPAFIFGLDIIVNWRIGSGDGKRACRRHGRRGRRSVVPFVLSLGSNTTSASGSTVGRRSRGSRGRRS